MPEYLENRFFEVKLPNDTYQAGPVIIDRYVKNVLQRSMEMEWRMGRVRLENLVYKVEWAPEWDCHGAFGNVDVIYTVLD